MLRPGKHIGWKPFIKELFHAVSEDKVADRAAALAYYGMLAVFPFLIFVVTLGGIILDPGKIGQVVSQLGKVAPAQVVSIVEGRLHELSRSSGGGLLTLSVIGAFWAASGGITSLMNALNRTYDVVETRPFWKLRPLALGVTLVASILAILGAAVMFVVPIVGAWVGGPAGAVITWARFIVAGFIMMVFWAFLYWALPNVKPHRFQIVTWGSIVGVVLWVIASWGFAEYVRHFGRYGATYGALAGVIVLLIWMWISALVVLLGAEINKLLTPKEKLQQAPTGEARAGREEPPVPKTRKPTPEPA